VLANLSLELFGFLEDQQLTQLIHALSELLLPLLIVFQQSFFTSQQEAANSRSLLSVAASICEAK